MILFFSQFPLLSHKELVNFGDMSFTLVSMGFFSFVISSLVQNAAFLNVDVKQDQVN